MEKELSEEELEDVMKEEEVFDRWVNDEVGIMGSD